jgi:antitoxin FitA
MANLIVRNIDEAVIKALKLRASQHGVSVEAEHRKILEQVLLKPQRKSFAEVLSQIPNVENDADFKRVWDNKEQDSEPLDILLAIIPKGFQSPFDIQDFVNSPAIGQELL